MKSLILASKSVQRRKLFDLLGLKYQVRPSSAKEIFKIKTTCAALVKENALLKAQDIAGRMDEGIIVGCDTVVYLGNKELVLKPKSLKEAKYNLKKLMVSPQWVYSGLAIVDAKSGKKLVDHEKTKVFMDQLTDRQIDQYHKIVPPLDKAGGFDIEGVGSIFINRIEGCYTNVIGLPMTKLRVMLFKMGVSVLSVLLVLTFSSCTTEYNLAKKKQRTYLYGTEKEVDIGSKVAHQITTSSEIFEGVAENQRVNDILDRLVEVGSRKEIVYSIDIIDDSNEEGAPILNAFALPGGYMFIFKGLLDSVESDDQLAGVLAHEMAHITTRHGMERLQKQYASMLLSVGSIGVGGNVAGGVNLAIQFLMHEYSQADELEADRLAIGYMKDAGYNPTGLIEFLEIIKREGDKKIRRYSYWRTHPHTSSRVANIRKEITGALEFRDYIQLIGSQEDNESW